MNRSLVLVIASIFFPASAFVPLVSSKPCCKFNEVIRSRISLNRKPLLNIKATEPDGDFDRDLDSTLQNGAPSLDWKQVVKQSKVFWDLSFPYYKESKNGRWLFAGMIVMTLINSGVSVAFSYLGKDFWNALSAKDPDQFYFMLTKFGAALIVGAPAAVLYRFQRERLSVNWREWMTDRTLELYSQSRVYYSLERSSEIDNPDQRIAEDVRTFTTFSLQIFLKIITSVIDLVSFSAILYSIQPQLFGAIVIYATFGTIVTTFLGKSLVGLNFLKLQREADFRYSLVRLRENAESIAFYGGEDLEGKSITERFQKVMSNKRDLIGAQRNLEFFTTAYGYLIQILPVAVVAPQFFAGEIQLGIVSQSAGAFNHILGDLSIIINEFEGLSTFSAGIERLSQFYIEMRRVDLARDNETSLLKMSNTTETGNLTTVTSAMETKEPMIDLQCFSSIATEVGIPSSAMTIQGLTLFTPDRRRTLIRDLSIQLNVNENLLIVGDSGAGKSSLLRAIAGLWTAGEGIIKRPSDEDVYFLPQRPYCTIGTLKDQLLYPSLEEDYTGICPDSQQMSRSHLLRETMSDNDLLEVLDAVNLGDIAARVGDGDPIKGLQAIKDWSNMLSLGEQQRLAFGRLLVNRPKLVILDEATSALDMASEAKMYKVLQDLGSGRRPTGEKISSAPLSYISVGHRPSLLAYHDKKLRLNGEEKHDFDNIEQIIENHSNMLNL